MEVGHLCCTYILIPRCVEQQVPHMNCFDSFMCAVTGILLQPDTGNDGPEESDDSKTDALSGEGPDLLGESAASPSSQQARPGYQSKRSRMPSIFSTGSRRRRYRELTLSGSVDLLDK